MHLSARVAAADRKLTDAEWADVARELLDGAGVAGRDDAGGPRWVAVRHADDHIHVAVVLVRQDTCRRFWPFQDYPKLRATARAIERRLGLTLTAAADGTAAAALTRGEREKAQREGREPARVELARVVREAAVGSGGPAEFVALLARAGYLVEVRRGPSGDPLGYKIARPGDVTPIFFSGSKLAPDLSLPRLVRAWGATGRERDVADPCAVARRRADAARRAVRAARHGQLVEDPPRVREGARATALRRIARQLVRQRRLLGVPDEPGAAAVALAVALAALIREIAAWQRDRGRPHQADAALSAADALRRVTRGPDTPAIDDLSIPSSSMTTQRPRFEPRRGHAAAAPTTGDAGLW